MAYLDKGTTNEEKTHEKLDCRYPASDDSNRVSKTQDETKDGDDLSRRENQDPVRAGLLDKIVGSLRKREGFRHLWLGDSGMGKTEANKILVGAVQKAGLVDIILTTDDKSVWQVQYAGLERINPSDLIKRPPMGQDARHIVFRGIALTRTPGPDVDNLPHDVAQMAWGMVRQRPCSVLLNIDELADATNGHQGWNEEDIAQIYRKGRGVGISVVATTQLPQLLPREAFGLSDTIGIFRLASRETAYLRRYGVIDAKESSVIEQLKVGEFRMYMKGQSDAEIATYRFSL